MNALNIKQVASKVALGQSTIYRLVAKGEFPKPFLLVGNRTAWLEEDIDAWLADKAGKVPAARDDEARAAVSLMQQTAQPA